MRNMEKVWKAEQKYDQEKKRIAELQREIREERAREDIQKYAEEKGVVEKKDNMKLDWMYKGPGGMVDREEYLLGRPIDKSFEQMQHTEKASASSKNVVELDCLPSSVFSGRSEQVDLARKLQEDPLYIIKKKEIESRSQILRNPVKLKQLQELIKEEKSKKTKKHKKDKRKKSEKKKNRHDSDYSHKDGGKDLDALLAAKYIKLKEKLHKKNIAKLRKNMSSTSDADASNRNKANESDSSEGRNDCKPARGYGLQRTDGSRNHSYITKHQPILETQKRRDSSQSQSSPAKKVWVKPERKKLSEKEKEQKRQEMMNNAKWREKEREKNVAIYKAEDEKEKNQIKEYNGDFLRKQLSYAASQGSVESRIKANINHIQRSGREMNKNFARR
ncbi:hypothetical protein B7P43_G13620 [Cryptotermes secundus]|nr:hypothetical protein B7P43_G13620 [Cryptotermes secundus]